MADQVLASQVLVLPGSLGQRLDTMPVASITQAETLCIDCRRRDAAPTIAKPPTSIAQLAGSGTTPKRALVRAKVPLASLNEQSMKHFERVMSKLPVPVPALLP